MQDISKKDINFSISQPLGEYTDRLLQLCNETFATMYSNIFKRYWHDNRFLARMSQNYTTTNWQKGKFETYIPTRENLASNMQFFRIALKVVPALDKETAKTESLILQAPMQTPTGILDSELIIVVAPKLKKRGFIRGFKHIKMPGFLTAVIVSQSPEIAFKRILTLIAKFIEKRMDKLLETLGFQPWEYDYQDKEKFYYIWIRSIIERYSHSLGLVLRSFSHVLAWVRGKLKSILHEIGLANMAKQAMRPLEQLSKADQIRVLEQIKAVLQVSVRGRTEIPDRQNFAESEPVKSDEGLAFLKALANAKPCNHLDRSKVDWGPQSPVIPESEEQQE